jgi:predicted DNA-binding transcriptional regulator YafY
VANVSEKKIKLLYLMELFVTQTDEQHALPLSRIMEILTEKGVSAERKSIYDDMETLRTFGMKIQMRKGKTFEYYLEEHPLTPEDTKVILDLVKQKHAIEEILPKWKRLCGPSGKELIESVFAEHAEIEIPFSQLLQKAQKEKMGLSFQYMDWEPDKNGVRTVLRKDGKVYTVFPLGHTPGRMGGLLLAKDLETGKNRSFYCDRLVNPQIVPLQNKEQEYPSLRQDAFVLEADKEALAMLYQRFPSDLECETIGKNHYLVTVTAVASQELLYFFLSLGTGAKVLSPKKMAEQVREKAKSIAKLYK